MKALVTVVLTVFSLLQPFAVQAREAQIDETKISASYQFQQTPVWCWAASIQMALRYYGVDIDQQTIVARTFGVVIPTTGDFIAISSNLNYSFDSKKKKYIVSASILPVNSNPFFSNPWAATPEAIVNHLKKGRPIVVAYQSSYYSGHAVLLSGVTYEINPLGRVELRSLTVRDPYPYNPIHVANHGKVTYPNGQFPGLIQAIWLVDITEV